MSGNEGSWPPSGLPWTLALEQQLARQLQQGRMPHAICLEGPAGIGKAILAERLVGMLLCSAELPMRPCGECAECLLLKADSHPDRMLVVPDTKTGRTISVEAVRGLIERVSMRPQRQGVQIATLVPADALNRSAANALLKTLEEPSPDSHLLLLSDDPGRLPVTVLSRCLRLSVHPPTPAVALAWLIGQGLDQDSAELALELGDGRPLLAKQACEGDQLAQWQAMLSLVDRLRTGKLGVVAAATQMAKSPDEALEVLQRLLEAVMDAALGGNKFTRLQELVHLTSKVEESTLQAVWLACKRTRQELGSGLRADFALAGLIKQVGVALGWWSSQQPITKDNLQDRGSH